MIGYLTLILTCQLIGEAVVGVLGLPVPGPVLGMLILFCGLLIRGGLPPGLAEVGDGLLRSLSLLFVPAGTGVMMHMGLLGEALLPLGLGLVVSSSLAFIVTGLLMKWLLRDG
jgi:holin-like protein